MVENYLLCPPKYNAISRSAGQADADRSGSDRGKQKKERPDGRSFVSSLGKDYLLILRRSAKASAPRPNRPIVAGSGMGFVTVAS